MKNKNMKNKNMKNVLFIGNSILLQSTKFLPNILNQINYQEEINIYQIYIPSSNYYIYKKYFFDILDESLTYQTGNAKLFVYKTSENSKKYVRSIVNNSIYNILTSINWDAVCLNYFHTRHHARLVYDIAFNAFSDKSFFKLITNNYKGNIFIISEPIMSYLQKPYKSSIKYFYDDDENKDIKYLKLVETVSKNMLKLEKQFNFNYIPTIECFNLLQQSKLNNSYKLLFDGRHVDPYIGCYLYHACIYYSIFYKWTLTKLSDIKLDIPVKESNKQYKYNDKLVDCYSVPLTEENKAIVDNIVETCYNINNRFVLPPMYFTKNYKLNNK